MPDNPISLPVVPGSTPFLDGLDTAPAYWAFDILWILLASGQQTGGRYSLLHETLPRGAGAPPHKHGWSDEHFYLLEGRARFLVGDEVFEGGPGQFVFVPRDTRHAFRILSETAILLNGYTPSGLELSLIETAMPATTRTLPPKGAAPPASMTEAQMRRYGMEPLPGPDPLVPGGPSEDVDGE